MKTNHQKIIDAATEAIGIFEDRTDKSEWHLIASLHGLLNYAEENKSLLNFVLSEGVGVESDCTREYNNPFIYRAYSLETEEPLTEEWHDSVEDALIAAKNA